MAIRLSALLLALLALGGCRTAFTGSSARATPAATAVAQDRPAPTAGVRSPATTPDDPGSGLRLPTSLPLTASPTTAIATATALAAKPAASATGLPATPTAAPTLSATATAAATSEPEFSYPMGLPGRALGDGFFVRHGYAVENTWFNPGWWHTAEDWYLQEGDTAGARVYAVAVGEVVYAGSNYPGRVVIVQHAADLFSMYGHLDPALAVQPGQRVARGELIGTVRQGGDPVPGHLHFEIRTFFTTREVNGAAPRYQYRCGVRCPPGPGYWPIDAPDHPGALGWRNPTHLIARRALPRPAGGPIGEVVVATRPVSSSATLWSAGPGDTASRQVVEALALRPGERFPLLEVRAGAEDSRETGARAYQLWYRIALPDGRDGWVEAALPSTFETGADGRAASIMFNFFPAIAAP